MKHTYKISTLFLFLLLTIGVNAQGKYFSETMSDTAAWKTIVKPATAPWTEVGLTLASGTWRLFGAYWTNGPTGLCSGNIGLCRCLKDLGTGATVSYIVTPTLLHGVGTVTFVEGNLKITKHEIFYSTDNGTSWVSTGVVSSTAAGCLSQSVVINNKAANRVKIANPGVTAADLNLDLIEVTSTDPLAIKAESFTKVSSFKLNNYPNPFNPSTKIVFEVPQTSNVRLSVYNMLGEKVATLHEGIVPMGVYSTTFDAKGLTSGMYIYRLDADHFSLSKKMILMK